MHCNSNSFAPNGFRDCFKKITDPYQLIIVIVIGEIIEIGLKSNMDNTLYFLENAIVATLQRTLNIILFILNY